MKTTKEDGKNAESGTNQQMSRSPMNYRCVDQTKKILVYDFLREGRGDLKEDAIRHLKLCLHCREKTATILKINRYLVPKPADYLHAEESEVAPDDNSNHAHFSACDASFAQTRDGD